MGTSLYIREYGSRIGDYQLIDGWAKARGLPMFAETMAPPIGVIVEFEEKPVVALWCYECLGIGVAFLDMAISAPGTEVAVSAAAFKRAIEGCITIARTHAQEHGGDYCKFRCFTSPAVGRILESYGFAQGATGLNEYLLAV